MLARGAFVQAEQLARPWAQRPDAPLALQQVWGEALLSMGSGTLAVQAWQRVTARVPTPSNWLQLGQALRMAQRPSEALPVLVRAAVAGADPAPACAAALECPPSMAVARALSVAGHRHPDVATVGVTVARILEASGALDHAAATLEAVCARHPDHTEALLRHASILSTVGHLDRAAAVARQACESMPSHPETWRIAATIANTRGEAREAARLLDRALALAPNHPILLWARTRLMPAIPDSESEEQADIHAYDAGLHSLHALADRDLAARPGVWLEAILDAFPVHYTGGDCVERQRLHGRLVERIAGANFPLVRPRPPPRSRLRVGFVSSLFRRHTITKLFSGWMTELDRSRFEVVAYHLSPLEDDTTRALRACCDLWRALPGPIHGAVQTIQTDAPDVLIYPEVGMDPRIITLAGLRLAPRQAAAWGHPVTTGLSTLDAVLACDAMAVEPDRSWTTEARIDLPGIGITYPTPAPAPVVGRDHFGLPPDRTLLMCVQTLRKYRPRYDPVYVRIAQQVPEALFVFVSDTSAACTTQLKKRLAGAFTTASLDLDAHVRFLPRLSEPDWMSLLSIGDLFLDSPGWSGGNTTLEAISVGLPCLAWPGDTFRGRHCLGINHHLGLHELCPRTPEAWCAAAVDLARSPGRLRDLRRKIMALAPFLFDNPEPTRALEDWLRSQP